MNIQVVNDTSTATSIRLANPRGFCAGVDRAIDIVNRALDIFGAPIYVRHEVVHNKFVVWILCANAEQFLSMSLQIFQLKMSMVGRQS